MAHIQACTVCGKKVACLACSRKAPRTRAVATKAPTPRVSVCDLCGFGGKSCDCGGVENEFVDDEDMGGDGDFLEDEDDEEDDEPEGFGGGAVADEFDLLAAAFLSDDDEDPLGDNDDLEDDVTVSNPSTPRRPRSKGSMFAAVPIMQRAARTKKTSASGARNTSMTRAPYVPYVLPSQPRKQTGNTSGTYQPTNSGASYEMSLSDWVRSTGTVTQAWNNPADYMPARPAVLNGQIVTSKIHGGIDIAKLPIGQPITAFRGGQVVEMAGSSASTKGWGLTVVLKDREGNSHRYAHLNSVNVYKGQDVRSGDLIGGMGRSGTVFGRTGIHLHYEVKDKFGNLIDPATL